MATSLLSKYNLAYEHQESMQDYKEIKKAAKNFAEKARKTKIIRWMKKDGKLRPLAKTAIGSSILLRNTIRNNIKSNNK